jgi:hypothetical protein
VTGAARADRSAAAWIFLFFACLYLATFGGHFYTGDGIEMFKTAESLVLRGDLAVLPGVTGRLWGYPGVDGRRYSPYALGLSLVEAPLFASAHAVLGAAPLGETARARLGQAAAMTANVLVAAATCALLFLLGRQAGYGRRAAGGVALLYGAGTMAWVYSKHDFAEPLAALCLIGSVLHVARAAATGRVGHLVLAGAFNGYGFFTKYQMVLYTPILLAAVLAARRREGGPGPLARAFAFLLPGLPFGLANLAVNHARFGTWLRTGYGNQGEIFAGPGFLPAGLFGLTLSPGKGIVWFSPLVLAAPLAWRAFHRRTPALSRLSGALAGFTFLLFAPLWWWHGDWAWGPRYLLVALPFLVLPLGAWLEGPEGGPPGPSDRRRLRLLAALLVAGLLVNGLGLSVNFFHYLQALKDLDRVHDDWNYIPNLSPIRFHAHVASTWVLDALGVEPPDFKYRFWCDGVLEEQTIRMAAYARGGREPDFFFFRPRDTAAERAALGAAGILVAAAAALCGLKVRRILREPS